MIIDNSYVKRSKFEEKASCTHLNYFASSESKLKAQKVSRKVGYCGTSLKRIFAKEVAPVSVAGVFEVSNVTLHVG